MNMHALSRERSHETPINKIKAAAPLDNEKSETIQTYHELPSLRGKTYSFQDLPHESLNQFCTQVHQIHALLNIGKKITDPNVLMLNSTQKELVEMIIDNNKHALDQKSKYLTQRAGKYIKLLWKSEKFNDALLQHPVKIEKTEPHYASPIHNFRPEKTPKNKSVSPLSHQTDRSIDKNHYKINQGEKNKLNPATSRSKRIHSEDQKFSNVRLSKYEKKKVNEKSKQKSFQVDLTKNIAWKTMNTTKNFDDMLKILKKDK